MVILKIDDVYFAFSCKLMNEQSQSVAELYFANIENLEFGTLIIIPKIICIFGLRVD